MRVVFMGTPDFARTIFEALLDDPGVEVVALFTQPDRPVGRKQILTPPVIVEPARKAGIAIYQPERLDDTQAAIIRDLKPDMIVVAAFGQLVPASILSIAPCINLHTSLLPAYRGASPLQESLLRGDRYCGVTAMLMDEGL
ncbi:MAG: methionyl-tRNA formyltransferase, partial [Campylobacterales bacterium]